MDPGPLACRLGPVRSSGPLKARCNKHRWTGKLGPCPDCKREIAALAPGEAMYRATARFEESLACDPRRKAADAKTEAPKAEAWRTRPPLEPGEAMRIKGVQVHNETTHKIAVAIEFDDAGDCDIFVRENPRAPMGNEEPVCKRCGMVEGLRGGHPDKCPRFET